MPDAREVETSSLAINDQLVANYEEHYYSHISSEELRWNKVNAIDKAKNVVALCSKTVHNNILEIGCGDGAILERLDELQFGNNLYGLEVSPTAVKLTNKKGIKSLTECKLFDGASIPYEANHFDLAILSHVVEHLEHPRQLLREAGRVSRRIFVEVPLEDTLRLKKNYIEDTLGHINVYSPKTIRWLVQTCGFEVLNEMVNIPSFAVFRSKQSLGKKALLLYPPARVAVQLAPSIATRFFTCHGAILCKKSRQ